MSLTIRLNSILEEEFQYGSCLFLQLEVFDVSRALMNFWLVCVFVCLTSMGHVA